MKEAMAGYFERLAAKWDEAELGLPRAPWDPDVEPWFWASPPDANEDATWRPVEKTTRHDLGALAPELGTVHPSLDDYFNAWWFASLEGQHAGYGITLEPVLPGVELDSFLFKARGYAARFGGPAPRLPIGVEFNGLQLVVDNQTGAVGVEDWERDEVLPLAPSLAALIERLQP